MNEESTILLRQVRIVDPVAKRDFIADVLIMNGRVCTIETQITNYTQDAKIIDGTDLILGTGLVDLYSHSGEPGNEARETLFSLAASAAAGGFVEVGILPDTIPRIDNYETLTALQQKVNRLSENCDRPLARLNFWTTLTSDRSSKQMNELVEIGDRNIGFTEQIAFTDLSLFKQTLEYLQPLQKPIAIDVSQNQLTNSGFIREGTDSIRYGLVGNPAYSEASAIAAIIEIIANFKIPVHIMRVSTARGVELIADAKQRGVSITASTTWMHLLLSTKDLLDYNPNLRLEPPLGTSKDLQALRQGIKTGVIDAIAIDHQAYTYEEKTVPFGLAPPGAIGLQLALPLLWQNLVMTNILSAIELWQALSLKPLLCLQKPLLKINSSISDLILFDTKKNWRINKQNMHSLSANTIWWNREIEGKTIFWHSL